MRSETSPLLDRFFRRIEIRDLLSVDEKAALVRASDERRGYRAGSDIVKEGDYPSHSTLLLSGMTTRHNFTEDGQRQITAIHVPGDFVDLQSFTLKKMDHSIGALTDCEVLTYPHSALREITEHYPHLTRLLWMLSTLDSAIHRKWLVAMGRTSALAHLAHLICETYIRLETVGLAANYAMSLPVTQTQIGDVLGLSAVHVNRVLQDLRSRGLVIWAGDEISIPDWHKLASVGQFDSEHLFLERIPR